MQFIQRRVLVNGGSRGIGRAIVEHFLAEGAEVVLCARGEAGVVEAADCFGERAFGMSADITDSQQVRGWITRSALYLGGIGIVVPNVSALAGGGDLDTRRCAFKTDLLDSAGMVATVLSWLKRSEAASVVLISSAPGRGVDMLVEPYGVLKVTLVYYGKTPASRHAEDGIRVNMVSPGNVYFEDGVWGAIERDSPEIFTRCLAANPMGRMVRPGEVARAVLPLASPAASFTTETSLLVDGGSTRGVQL